MSEGKDSKDWSGRHGQIKTTTTATTPTTISTLTSSATTTSTTRKLNGEMVRKF